MPIHQNKFYKIYYLLVLKNFDFTKENYNTEGYGKINNKVNEVVAINLL